MQGGLVSISLRSHSLTNTVRRYRKSIVQIKSNRSIKAPVIKVKQTLHVLTRVYDGMSLVTLVVPLFRTWQVNNGPLIQ